MKLQSRSNPIVHANQPGRRLSAAEVRGCPDGQDGFNENGQGRTQGGNHTYAAMCHDAQLRKKRIRCLHGREQAPCLDAAGNEQAIAALKASNKRTI